MTLLQNINLNSPRRNFGALITMIRTSYPLFLFCMKKEEFL